MRILTFLPVALAVGISLTSPATADNHYDQFNDRFRIYLGGFWPSLDSTININGDFAPPGPPISIEDTLGVEDSKGVAWGGARWRISRRNSLEFEVFALKRDGGVSGTFTPPIQIGDTFIETGAINTKYDTSVGRVTYGFSLVRSERMDVQLKAGLHLATLDAGFSLSGNVCDPTTTPMMPPGCPGATTGVEDEDITAPLPHFGVSFAYALTPSVAFNFEVIGFALEIGSIDGAMIEVDADLSWQPFRHFGGGIGFRYFNVNVEATGSDLNGEFDYEYFGPVVYVQSTF
jgi:hypothetical protein